jgi:hypothetical protein
MQTRSGESRAHSWPWAPDVTSALLCLIVGLLLVLASVIVPAQGPCPRGRGFDSEQLRFASMTHLQRCGRLRADGGHS